MKLVRQFLVRFIICLIFRVFCHFNLSESDQNLREIFEISLYLACRAGRAQHSSSGQASPAVLLSTAAVTHSVFKRIFDKK